MKENEKSKKKPKKKTWRFRKKKEFLSEH